MSACRAMASMALERKFILPLGWVNPYDVHLMKPWISCGDKPQCPYAYGLTRKRRRGDGTEIAVG